MSEAVICIVGRPNVGKSTLFNRLCRSRQALVSDFEGLTRDRQYAQISLNDTKTCTLIDTGGLTQQKNEIDKGVQQQVMTALTESDVIYFILSSQDGITTLDFEIASNLRKLKKKIILICNKSEGLYTQGGGEFFQLGLGEPILISAKHNQGIDNLMEQTLPLLPAATTTIDKPLKGIVVAILGRPNVGKSTLINQILGEQRVLAYNLPGTTRDSIYIPFERNNQQYTLIDTAGIRRKRSSHDKIEKFSIIKAIDALEKSSVVILILDAHASITEQDATLLGMIEDKGRALLIAINKWDGLDNYQKLEIKRKLTLKLSFVNYATLHYISALHGSGVGKLFSPIEKAYTSASAKFATPLLNNILASAKQKHLPPPVKGRRLKIKYIHQFANFPPTFALYGNHLEHIPNAYERYLKNFFIKALNLSNTTIKFQYKTAQNPFKNKKNTLSGRQIKKKRRLLKFHSRR